MDNMFLLLRSLVAIQTVTGTAEAINEALSFVCKTISPKLHCELITDGDIRALSIANTTQHNTDLILSCHIDVVPGPQDLFTLKKDGDKLIGRGTYDMKGALVACLVTMEMVVRESIPLRVRLIITTDEEWDMQSLDMILRKKHYTAPFAILPDGGSQQEIVTHEKGALWLEITTTGTSSHGARPWLGNNALYKMIDLINTLQKHYPDPTEEHDWKPSLTVTRIRAGKAPNQVPNEAHATVDLRFTHMRERNKLMEILSETADCSYMIKKEIPVLEVQNTVPQLITLMETIHAVTNNPSHISRESGASEAYFYVQRAIPTVLFRPDGGGAHENTEWVSLKSLKLFQEILLTFCRNLASAKTTESPNAG